MRPSQWGQFRPSFPVVLEQLFDLPSPLPQALHAPIHATVEEEGLHVQLAVRIEQVRDAIYAFVLEARLCGAGCLERESRVALSDRALPGLLGLRRGTDAATPLHHLRRVDHQGQLTRARDDASDAGRAPASAAPLLYG